MRYPIAIEIGSKTAAFGVVVPDLPGCFSAGDTIDEAVSAAEESAAAWIDATLDTGGTIPAPTSIEAYVLGPNLSGGCSESSPWIRLRWIIRSSG
jgi:predicted RNase H-like HicB family nuclease